MKKWLSMILALVVVLALSACGGEEKKKDEEKDSKQGSEEQNDENSVSDEDLSTEKGVYTFRDVWEADPLNWSPHAWETSGDFNFMWYLVTPIAYADISDNENGWDFKYSAATDVKDVTKEFADKEKFGIPADAEKEYVYQIDLNPEMVWENGDKITADDYIYSMQQILNPEMKNYRSQTYYSGDLSIANAAGYFNNDKAGKPVYKPFTSEDKPEGTAPLATMTMDVLFFGNVSAKSYYENETHKPKFTVNGTDIFAKYKDKETFEVTDEVKADLTALAVSFGDENPEAWQEFCVFDSGEKYPETPWEKVGLIKTGEYQIQYILNKPAQRFYFLNSMSSAWLVHKDTYEKNKEKKGDLVSTKYNIGLDNTMSYGPYKLKAFEKGKQYILERNENWGGYKDGNHEGQFQADRVVIDVISNHATALQRFGQGLADTIGINSDDMEIYKRSDRLFLEDLTYTYRLIFATSLESLKAKDAEKGSGKRVVLNYKDFRKALSLAFDRQKFCDEATAGMKPAVFLFNNIYHYDIANDPGSVYRKSVPAKKAILDVYGVKYTDSNIDEEYEKITGRDVKTAKELFQKAYEQAKADGNYADGEEVPIEIMVHPTELSPQHIKQQDLIQKFFDEASVGTGFEGKIKVKFEAGDEKRYDNVALGKNTAIIGAWGGAAFYPFSLVRHYVNTVFMGGLEKVNESNGWNPTQEKLTLTITKADGKTITEERTFEDWSNQINGGQYTDDPNERLQVLAGLEKGIIEAYQCIPFGTATSATLLSYKLEHARPNDYNIMSGYGGFRNLKFNYDDAAWAEYLKENKGKLNYE